MSRWTRSICAVALLLLPVLLCASGAASSTPLAAEAIAEELSEPISVQLTRGRSLVGRPVEVAVSNLTLASASGAGEVRHIIPTADIRSIELPGDHYQEMATRYLAEGRDDAALQLMTLLYGQRGPLLPLLPDAETHFFIPYVRLVLDSPKPARAIAITRALGPQIVNPDARAALEAVTLESYARLEMHEDAARLARAWLDRNPPHAGGAALARYVLAAAALRDFEYEIALDHALMPVVFSLPAPPAYLAECYAVAIAATIALRERDYAARLLDDMRERKLLWPEDAKPVRPYEKRIHSLPNFIETSSEAAAQR